MNLILIYVKKILCRIWKMFSVFNMYTCMHVTTLTIKPSWTHIFKILPVTYRKWRKWQSKKKRWNEEKMKHSNNHLLNAQEDLGWIYLGLWTCLSFINYVIFWKLSKAFAYWPDVCIWQFVIVMLIVNCYFGVAKLLESFC